MLSVNSEKELELWAERLEMNGINFKIFWEPDNNTGWSALATAPISRQEGKVLKKLMRWNPERDLMAA